MPYCEILKSPHIFTPLFWVKRWELKSPHQKFFCELAQLPNSWNQKNASMLEMNYIGIRSLHLISIFTLKVDFLVITMVQVKLVFMPYFYGVRVLMARANKKKKGKIWQASKLSLDFEKWLNGRDNVLFISPILMTRWGTCFNPGALCEDLHPNDPRVASRGWIEGAEDS